MSRGALNKFASCAPHIWHVVIFVGACLLTFLVEGTHDTFGVLFVNLLKEKNEGEQKIAWIGSIGTCLSMLGAVPAVKFCSKAGIPITWFVGTVMCSIGFIATSFASSTYLMYFTYGALYGIGSCLLYTTCMILLPHVFTKYQSITTGLVQALGSTGSLVLAPVLESGMRRFGIKATLIAEGLVFFCVGTICALTVIPLSSIEKGCTTKSDSEKGERRSMLTDGEEMPLIRSSDALSMYTEPEVPVDSSRNMMRTDQDDVIYKKRTRSIEPNNNDRFRLNSSLFKRKEYLLFLVIMVITNFTYYIPLTHLINYAEGFGTSSSKAALLITFWSVSHIVGCAAFGAIATRYPTKRMRSYQIAMLTSGITSILASVADQYGLLVAYAVMHGFLDGSFSGMQSLATLDVVGLDDLGQGFGILTCIIAIPCGLGPALVGWVNDTKVLPRRSMFYISGVPFIAGSLLMILLIKWIPSTVTQPRKTSESSQHAQGLPISEA